jgi:hypothetical protein
MMQKFSITIDRVGPYLGEVEIDRQADLITVTHDGHSISTQIGGTPRRVLADLLLAELVREVRQQ